MTGIGYRASDGMLIVPDVGAESILMIDPADGTVVSACDSPSARPWGVALSGDNVWVLDDETGLLSDLGPLTEVGNERWTWG